MDLTLVGILLGTAGLIVGVLGSTYVHERFIDPFRFRKNKGRIVQGEYISVWYTNTNNPPVTWEKGIFEQRGRKLRYHCEQNNCGFNYEMLATIEEDVITGHWRSQIPGENVHGGATLYVTKRAHIVGMWVGDSKMNNFTWGYWAISKDKRVLERFVKNMDQKVKFRGVDLVELFDEGPDISLSGIGEIQS